MQYYGKNIESVHVCLYTYVNPRFYINFQILTNYP